MSSRRKTSKPVSLNVLTSGNGLTASTSKGGVSKQVPQPGVSIGYGHLGKNDTASTTPSVAVGGLGAAPAGGTSTTTQPPNTAPQVPPLIPIMTQDQQAAALQAAAFFMSL